MRNCQQCGGRLKRVHRTFLERFMYLAIYECRDCKDVCSIPHAFRYHFGPETRCPRCGTLRITRLKTKDGIDPMESGVLQLIERLLGGKLYHCRFCRIQFYDRRNAAPAEQNHQDKGLAKTAE